jgi:predicted aspartyl protease
MGIFNTLIGIANPQAGEFHWVDALVDTGAVHTMLPASLLEQTLNLAPTRQLLCELADGRQQSYGYGRALFRIEDLEEICPVIFGPEDQYLLGATALENFNLIPDTSHQRLIPAPAPRVRL